MSSNNIIINNITIKTNVTHEFHHSLGVFLQNHQFRQIDILLFLIRILNENDKYFEMINPDDESYLSLARHMVGASGQAASIDSAFIPSIQQRAKLVFINSHNDFSPFFMEEHYRILWLNFPPDFVVMPFKMAAETKDKANFEFIHFKKTMAEYGYQLYGLDHRGRLPHFIPRSSFLTLSKTLDQPPVALNIVFCRLESLAPYFQTINLTEFMQEPATTN